MQHSNDITQSSLLQHSLKPTVFGYLQPNMFAFSRVHTARERPAAATRNANSGSQGSHSDMHQMLDSYCRQVAQTGKSEAMASFDTTSALTTQFCNAERQISDTQQQQKAMHEVQPLIPPLSLQNVCNPVSCNKVAQYYAPNQHQARAKQ